RRLNSIVEEKDALLKAKDEEIRSLKAQLVLKEAEAAEAIRLRGEASNFQAVEKSLQSEVAALKECNNLLETDKSGLDVTVADLAALVKVKEREVADLDVVVTSVKLQNDNLVDQDGLSVGITYGAEGRKLSDVAAYNLSTEADYLFVLQRIQSVNFSLFAELKANKDASVETIMNLLRREDALAEKLGSVESQPHVDQLMVHIHHSPDERTSGAAPDTTTALFVSSVFASTIPPISTDDYEVVHTDGQEGSGVGGETVADESVVHFPNVSDAELDVSECNLLL
nr:hypothetical protein [Tanacetum cinerariifolium]